MKFTVLLQTIVYLQLFILIAVWFFIEPSNPRILEIFDRIRFKMLKTQKTLLVISIILWVASIAWQVFSNS